MQKFDQLTGVAAPLDILNIDADMIIPKQFLKTIKRSGLGKNLFDEMRYDRDGSEMADFVLNRAPYRQAEILVAGDNFGCGSSREHAVWGMRQLKIDACIGTGFAGIFYDNARKNGLALPVVSPEVRDLLLQFSDNQSGAEISINLERRMIAAGESSVPFEMDDATRIALIRGRDDTLDTLSYASAIREFETGLDEKMRISVIK